MISLETPYLNNCKVTSECCAQTNRNLNFKEDIEKQLQMLIANGKIQVRGLNNSNEAKPVMHQSFLRRTSTSKQPCRLIKPGSACIAPKYIKFQPWIDMRIFYIKQLERKLAFYTFYLKQVVRHACLLQLIHEIIGEEYNRL